MNTKIKVFETQKNTLVVALGKMGQRVRKEVEWLRHMVIDEAMTLFGEKTVQHVNDKEMCTWNLCFYASSYDPN